MRVFIFLLSALLISCGSSPHPGGSVRRSVPAWVHSVDSVFSREYYAAATGFASSRVQAEANALAALTAFFGQTVEVDSLAAVSYRQAIVNGVMDGWIDTAEMRTNVNTYAVMDNLIGVEIREVWFDSRNTHYAVAVMEKAKAVRIYNELIQANLNIINNLLSMTHSEKFSLNGVIRYQFASTAADINTNYGNIVRLLGGNPPPGIVSGDLFRLEAQNIIRAIPIGINVTYDRHGRIFGAFARIFADYGFEIVSEQALMRNLRYVLNVNVNISPVDLPNNPAIFVRIELDAALRDNNLGIILIPYTFNSREGHNTMSEAENRSIVAAERHINSKFAKLVSDYFYSLFPRH